MRRLTSYGFWPVAPPHKKSAAIDPFLRNCVRLLVNLGVNFLVDSRDCNHNGRFQFQQRLRKLIHIRQIGESDPGMSRPRSTFRAVTCESGKKEMLSCPGWKLNRLSHAAILEAMLPCVSTTPLGVPVVPEV